MTETMFGVYRQFANGKQKYLPRSCTSSEKLAREIAEERSRGEVTLPTGQVRRIAAHPHIAKRI